VATDLSSLANYGLGGTAVTPDHVELAERAGIARTRAYGLTEHSTVSVGWRDMPFEQRAHTDGRLQPDRSCASWTMPNATCRSAATATSWCAARNSSSATPIRR
jgi:hypothetical protein